MSKEDNKVNFDLSTLSLTELISLYDKITSFLAYLEDTRIEEGDA